MRLGKLGIDGDRLPERLDRLVEVVGLGVRPPQLGEGGEAVLAEAGFAEGEIEALRAAGVV